MSARSMLRRAAVLESLADTSRRLAGQRLLIAEQHDSGAADLRRRAALLIYAPLHDAGVETP